jgi:hypothetical protein
MIAPQLKMRPIVGHNPTQFSVLASNQEIRSSVEITAS